ncbi:haloacid dehalogenase type II [Jannaschia rubra]|uniref:(S)-2-haloacid dehalogenase n=1 Tax=Jannaschia rubra TaxID=282197 RepID=A0A0M6XKE0_9RHOB|nr:haloacid dehalogenase type II [Jannaschia rubra]CTQ31616.1 (S)-2-haloacid dehalogenase 4A [Jannaschia rubra]SFF76258.1 2-haloacid dehalogenase [Jannaschia rubra]
MPMETCIFDAYGTLFDVTSAAREAASEDGFEALSDHWRQVARDWREKQLQYTWLRAVTDDHADFHKVTGDALDWALEAAGLDDPALRDRLMQLYGELVAYPDVTEALQALKDAGRATGILSNGSPEMLQEAVASAGIGRLLDHVLSVESVGVYKPSFKVYDMVGRAFGGQRRDVLYVSANGWDAAAAAGYGFTSVWVNRAGQPMERLPWTPAHVLSDLSGIPDLAASI